jgi:hypothetical protein
VHSPSRSGVAFSFLLLGLLGAGCVIGASEGQSPAPPKLAGDPPIGQKLDLQLTDASTGEPARLRGVPGRVTVICAFQEVISLEPCRSALSRFQDRVSVAGIATADPAVVPTAPFRIFVDARSEKLVKDLSLTQEDRVLVIDRQGRVRAVIPPEKSDEVLRQIGDLAG